MSSAVVSLREVFKTYRYGRTYVRALRGVTLGVDRGDIACVVGPSGSGKSTLLNIIAAVDTPDRGEVVVDGIEVHRLKGAELALYRLRKVGYVFQFYNLIPTLTVWENVELPLALAGVPKAERSKKVSQLLEAVGIPHLANRTPDSISSGEQQRAAIARALTNTPAVVLMDEPSASLDVENTIKVMELVSKLNKSLGQTFIIATHDPLVARYCRTVFKMRDGQIAGVFRGAELAEVLRE